MKHYDDLASIVDTEKSVTTARDIADAPKYYDKLFVLIKAAIKGFETAEKSAEKFIKDHKDGDSKNSHKKLIKDLDDAVGSVREALSVYDDVRGFGEFARNKYVNGPLNDSESFYEDALACIEAIQAGVDWEGEDPFEMLIGSISEAPHQLKWAEDEAEKMAKELKEKVKEHKEAAKSYDKLAELAETAFKAMEEFSNMANEHGFDDLVDDSDKVIKDLESLQDEVEYRKDSGE